MVATFSLNHNISMKETKSHYRYVVVNIINVKSTVHVVPGIKTRCLDSNTVSYVDNRTRFRAWHDARRSNIEESVGFCTDVHGHRAQPWPRVRPGWMRWLVDLSRTASFEDTLCYSYSLLNRVQYKIDFPLLSPSTTLFSLRLPLGPRHNI